MEYYSVQACSQPLYMFMEYAMLINATHTCSQSLSIFIVFDVFQADQGVPQLETAAGESCTFRRTSSLTLNVTRREAGKRLVVRCRVNHPSQGNSNTEACQDPNVDYCRMSQQIDVQCKLAVSLSVICTTKQLTCSSSG